MDVNLHMAASLALVVAPLAAGSQHTHNARQSPEKMGLHRSFMLQQHQQQPCVLDSRSAVGIQHNTRDFFEPNISVSAEGYVCVVCGV